MAALSQHKIEIVRSLVESAPDKVVCGLQQALAEAGADSTLASVKRLVEAEALDRSLRNVVLAPIVPLCGGQGSENPLLTFPPGALRFIWRGLTSGFPDLVETARAGFLDTRPGHHSDEPYDALVAVAARELREGRRAGFDRAVALCEAVRPKAADRLAACLDIGPVVRVAVQRLPEWLTRPGEETAAGARLAYKDAVTVAEDSGPAFFEMLAAHMAHPWMVLRIISAVMDRPTERYLADSEMAGFGERVVEKVDDSLGAIARLDLDGGPEAGRVAGRLVELITHQLTELDSCMDLSRDHGWGQRIAKQRASLASVVEGRLRDAEKLTVEALPTQPARLKRIRRTVPRLDDPPLAQTLTRAMTLLHFTDEIRSSANYGGFSATRAKVLEKLAEYIDHYVEETLDLLKTGEAGSVENAVAYLNVAADFNGLVQGEKAAELVRRRAVAAVQPEALAAEA